jgi:hypothetical protein
MALVMPLVLKLAARNLLYDKLRLAATVVGIVFSILLVTVQLGLFVSFERTVTVMIDHTSADLWIVPLGTKCFEDSSLLEEGDRYRALSVEGVAEVLPILVSFAQWRMPDGSTTSVLVIGSDLQCLALSARAQHRSGCPQVLVRETLFAALWQSPIERLASLPPDPLKDWFDHLASDKGMCCSFADGFSVSDVDWEMQNGHYRVLLHGEWIDVPDTAVVTGPNRSGRAVVWPYMDNKGNTNIRCFLPGAGA